MCRFEMHFHLTGLLVKFTSLPQEIKVLPINGKVKCDVNCRCMVYIFACVPEHFSTNESVIYMHKTSIKSVNRVFSNMSSFAKCFDNLERHLWVFAGN